MCRHSVNRQELMKRIHDGQLGPIQLIRAYRMEGSGPLTAKRPADLSELQWQIRNRSHILWVSGGLWAEMDIHQIDEICWLKDDQYPVSAHGICGRVANSKDLGQGLDSFSVEYTFPDGAKAYDVVRYIPKCYPEFATYVHGTKCAAQFSGVVNDPLTVGSGEFLPLEFPLAYWLEQHGYDVTYCANLDLTDAEHGLKCKCFISVGHDEYWDIRQYESAVKMRDAATPMLEKGNAFIAVGALHLPGETGLVSLLRERGYTVSPVE
jgi:hypothetical protein